MSENRYLSRYESDNGERVCLSDSSNLVGEYQKTDILVVMNLIMVRVYQILVT